MLVHGFDLGLEQGDEGFRGGAFAFGGRQEAADFLQREAEALGAFDEGDELQGAGIVRAVAVVGSGERRRQAFRLVEPDAGRGDAATGESLIRFGCVKPR